MSVVKPKTPGVYAQETPLLPNSVAEVETAIPAFVGHTEKAIRVVTGDLKNVAVKITSLSDFESFYGGPPTETNDSITIEVIDNGGDQYDIKAQTNSVKLSPHNLYYALKHFYDNGGGTCYIVSIGNFSGAFSSTEFLDGFEIVKGIDEVTLLVAPESCKLVAADYKTVVGAMINQASVLMDRFAIIDPLKVTPNDNAHPSGDIQNDIGIIRNVLPSGDQNSFGAAYYPTLVSTYNLKFDFDNLTVASYSGTRSDIMGKKMSDLGTDSILYNKIKAVVQTNNAVLPPSGAMAGIYTRVDKTKGVWKVPANESLVAVIRPNVAIPDTEQAIMNIDPVSGKSINAIRSFPGMGTLVWGARTLNGNDNEWRYINVRRFFNMVEESIKKSSQWALFEPNTISTWVKMQTMIGNYLFQKWREGALAGSKPDQAYFVRVGLGTTMTSTDILEGKMKIETGMAVLRPAEFIILAFTLLMQQS